MPRASSLLVLLVALAGCLGDAPRDNPFDPLSEQYDDEGSVSGTVTGISGPPYTGRESVRVSLVPTEGGRPVEDGVELAATTRLNGTFVIGGVPAGTYLVRAEGAGLRPEADTVEVTPRGTAEVVLRLNALPVVTSQAARTVHIEQFFPDIPVFRLEVEATVTDPDRPTDVDKAELVAEDLGFRAPLVEVAPGRFAATFDADRLPGGQVQSLLGQPLRIEATDIAGNVGAGPPLALVRVIEQTPLTRSPQGETTVATAAPVLEWAPAQLPFAFTYRVDLLVEGAGIPVLVETVSGIDPFVTTYTVSRRLAPGRYAWTVWVVDANGNRSRSKEAGFIVPNGL